jgi:hypothetical protein
MPRAWICNCRFNQPDGLTAPVGSSWNGCGASGALFWVSDVDAVPTGTVACTWIGLPIQATAPVAVVARRNARRLQEWIMIADLPI